MKRFNLNLESIKKEFHQYTILHKSLMKDKSGTLGYDVFPLSENCQYNIPNTCSYLVGYNPEHGWIADNGYAYHISRIDAEFAVNMMNDIVEYIESRLEAAKSESVILIVPIAGHFSCKIPIDYQGVFEEWFELNKTLDIEDALSHFFNTGLITRDQFNEALSTIETEYGRDRERGIWFNE